MKILVTGSAGFIGAALTAKLLATGNEVVGVDSHNDYYDPRLKEDRLALFVAHPGYTHLRLNLADREGIDALFKEHQPKRVVNLAAQAGVRYSLENPSAYIDANIVGFANILEGCRRYGVEHLVYASTSSVYGANTQLPYSVHQNTDHPLSLYAATKKANELMAHSYSHLYGIPSTGLRFFTVYGPWGRPDMALFKFTKAILKNEPIQLFNSGRHVRDFTYIDDIVEGIVRVLSRPAGKTLNWNGNDPDPSRSAAPFRIYNIGNSKPVKLLDYVGALEKALGKSAKKEWLPVQSGDVLDTHADIRELIDDFEYQPRINIDDGVRRFVSWYLNHYRP
jgi:UDP-glucuronate 4-epimerase